MVMANKFPIPINERKTRAPEHGRIRIGTKQGNRPVKLSTFRFTSPDADTIRKIADLYGGEAKPWNDPGHPGQWEVITETNSIPVIFPANATNEQRYELWGTQQGKKGVRRVRSCDGTVCTIERITPYGPEPEEHPCLCRAAAKMECKLMTRLNVVLRDLPYGGTWTYSTTGEIAGDTLPASIELFQKLQQGGMTVGVLRIASTKHAEYGTIYYVTAGADVSLAEIAAGAASLSTYALGQAAAAPVTAPALTAGPTVALDDEPIEAEIVEPLETVAPLDVWAHTITKNPAARWADLTDEQRQLAETRYRQHQAGEITLTWDKTTNVLRKA